MTTSRRLADRKVEKFEKNITKRGAVPETTAKKGKDYPVGPILLGFFVFVVIGSCMPLIIQFYKWQIKSDMTQLNDS
ncbi:unnamed protein product [Prunus armeniaca]